MHQLQSSESDISSSQKRLEGANPTSRYVISKGVFPDGNSKLLSEAASALCEEAAMVIDLLILQFKIIAEFQTYLSGKKHPSNCR
jgi:hypothetical protein